MTRHKSRGFGYSIEGGANRAFTLHHDGFAHLLNALGVASGLARPEQDSANCAHNCRKSGKPKGVWGKELPDEDNQRSPL